MNTPSRNKPLIFIIAILLLTNIAVLVYFLGIKKNDQRESSRPDRRNGLTEMLQKEVGFNDQQLSQYKQLRDEQLTTIKPMFDEMRKAKDSLFKLLSNPSVNDSIINKASDEIAKKQKILDLQTFAHFKKVRALCLNPDQQTKYDSMIQRMFRKMGRQNRKTEPAKDEHSK